MLDRNEDSVFKSTDMSIHVGLLRWYVSLVGAEPFLFLMNLDWIRTG